MTLYTDTLYHITHDTLYWYRGYRRKLLYALPTLCARYLLYILCTKLLMTLYTQPTNLPPPPVNLPSNTIIDVCAK